MEIWLAGQIFHYLRDPRDAVPSIVLENEAGGRNNSSFEMRRRKLLGKFGVDIACLDAPAAAVTSYALWNKLAEDLAAGGMIRVEQPELRHILPWLGEIPIRRFNRSEQKFGTTKPEIDLDDAVRRSPPKVGRIMDRYLSLYAHASGTRA